MSTVTKELGYFDIPDSPITKGLNISRGKQKRAQRVVIYGPEGVGKTTLASKFPNPLFLDVEKGSSFLDVDRIQIDTYDELTRTIEALLDDPHGYKTIVIDTIDWVEQRMAEQLCIRHKIDSIEDFGYGKGYTQLAESMFRFLNVLNEFIEKGIHVVLTGHSIQAKFELPGQQGQFDQYTLDLHKKVVPYVKEWSDALLFINWDIILKDKQGDPRSNTKFAAGGREGKIYTAHTATYDAKNRHGLPSELPLDYQYIAHIFEDVPQKEPLDPESLTLIERIENCEAFLREKKVKGYKTEAEIKKIREKIGGTYFIPGMTESQQERYFNHISEIAEQISKSQITNYK